MKINTPKEAMRKTRFGDFCLLRGRYTILSMTMPRMAERMEAKKKTGLD